MSREKKRRKFITLYFWSFLFVLLIFQQFLLTSNKSINYISVQLRCLAWTWHFATSYDIKGLLYCLKNSFCSLTKGLKWQSFLYFYKTITKPFIKEVFLKEKCYWFTFHELLWKSFSIPKKAFYHTFNKNTSTKYDMHVF